MVSFGPPASAACKARARVRQAASTAGAWQVVRAACAAWASAASRRAKKNMTTGVTRESLLEKTLFACDEMAGFLTVRDGLVVEHETFDCYPPLVQPV